MVLDILGIVKVRVGLFSNWQRKERYKKYIALCILLRAYVQNKCKIALVKGAL